MPLAGYRGHFSDTHSGITKVSNFNLAGQICDKRLDSAEESERNYVITADFVTLDPYGNYNVSWEVVGTTITFEVKVVTQGFVAFGISNDGMELESDIVIAEVNPNGTLKFKVTEIC
jgi:hypothetical protein